MVLSTQETSPDTVFDATHAAEADRTGQLSLEVARGLGKAGFAAWFVPEAFGGREGSYEELMDEVTALAGTCTSTAWLASLLAFGGRYASCLPRSAQEDIWREGPDAFLVTVIKPQGRVVPTEGGFQLSGEWTYVSGVEFSDWAMLMGPGGPPNPEVPVRLFLVPRADYSIEMTWDSLGMRATGSHTLTLDKVFVPAERTALRDDVMAGRGPEVTPGRQAPNVAVNGITFVAPALGAAKAALAEGRRSLRAPVTGPRAFATAPYLVEYGRAAAEWETAEFFLRRIARSADEGGLTPALVARNRRDATYALESLVNVVDRCLRISGTRGQSRDEPAQRLWRDVHSIASHAVMQFEPAATDYTKLELESAL
ncbi:MAG TPA: acyl-CoA dehydrogenase family protein [Jatrophihabitans sp.]|jgi:two-component flavin-dependent monooxygenase|uniref:acyl-CoA dehydrogenase family protein n=1 Tax=Jatrophihabitans sp. TaxID=1932789 RepID=UPI002F05F0FE